MSSTFATYFAALRPESFSMSTANIAIAAALSYHHLNQRNTPSINEPLSFSFSLLFLTWITATLSHSVGNIANTYYDYVCGVDKADSSDDRTLVDNKISIRSIRTFLITLTIASIVGFVLIGTCLFERQLPNQSFKQVMYPYMLLCAIGLAICFAYTCPPFALKHYALGDLAIAIPFGPLLCSVAFLSLTSQLPNRSQIWFMLPMGLLSAAVLHVNNSRDLIADKRAGLLTVPMIIGKNGSYIYYVICLLVSYAIMIVPLFFPQWLSMNINDHSIKLFNKPSLIAAGWQSYALLLPLLSLPQAVNLMSQFKRRDFRDLCPKTGFFALLFGMLQAAAIFIAFK